MTTPDHFGEFVLSALNQATDEWLTSSLTYSPDGLNESAVNLLLEEMNDLASETATLTTAYLDGTAAHRRHRRVTRRVIREVVALTPSKAVPNPNGWAA